MNFLAHLWLADRTGTSPAGAVLGDVVRGRDLSGYPPELALGIRLHRRIDALTDRHSTLQPLRERFPATTRRYAGIVLDLACDHALAQRWHALHAQPLPEFCARMGRSVAGAAPWFLHAGGHAPTAEGFADLLLSYATAPGIDRAVERIAARLRKPEGLLEAARGWPELTAPLQAALPSLLEDLRQGSRAWIDAA